MAILLCWEAVTLRNRNVSLVKSHLNNLGRDQYSKYSHLIKKLAFEDAKNCGYTDTFDRLKLVELLNQLPNLNEIDFSITGYVEGYLGYLLDADMQRINKNGTGQDFRYTPNDLLFSVYCKFRNSITCIELLNDGHTMNRLNSLTHDHPISESVMRHILDDSRRINLNFISSLTSLELRLPSLSAKYTKYLVDCFPDQLTDLTTKISDQNIFNWIDIVGMELALRLMKKAGCIEKTYLDFVQRDKYQGTRQTLCTANFNEARGT
ncbi:hypothetical protein HPULCUR_005337, partial [Helicostylum pulchrum]